MYNDEGTSNRSHLLRRDSLPPAPGASEIVPEEASGFTAVTVETDTFQVASKSALECRPPSLFDNYEVIGGVPAFVFRTQRRLFPMQLNYSVSSDGTHMVVVAEDGSICVYDLSDNCSLVVKSKHIPNRTVLYISFWNDTNDQIVVINTEGNIIFCSVKEELCMSNASEMFEEVMAYELVGTCSFNISQLDGEDFNVFVEGSTLWVAVTKRSNEIDSILMIRVTKEGSKIVEYHDEASKQMSDSQVHLGKDCAIVTPTKTPIGKENTYVISILDYENGYTRTSHPLRGILIAWDHKTNYFLIWRIQNEYHILDLYFLDDMKHDGSRPIVSLELGKELFSVKAAFLDRNVWMFNNFDKTNDVDFPLICVVSFKSSISILSVWNTHSDKILKQIDVTIDEMQTSDPLDIVFSVSKDIQWFILGLWNKNGIVAMFSFLSEVVVWSVNLELDVSHLYNLSLAQFDAISSKLIINAQETLYVFIPPCLVKGFDLKLKCSDAIINTSEEQIMKMTECPIGLFSQYTLLPLFAQIEYFSADFLSKARVGIPCCTLEIAILLLKEGSFSIIFASIDDMFSTSFRNLLHETSKGHSIDHLFREIKLNKEHDESILEAQVPFYLFLYPNKERTNDEIVIILLYEEHMEANFVSLDGATQKSMLYKETGILSCFQSNDRLRIICLKRNEILIIELEQRRIIYMAKYKVNLLFWLCAFSRERKHSDIEIYSIDDELVQNWVKTISLIRSHPDVSYDEQAILLGWKCDEKKPLLLTPKMQTQDLDELLNQEQTIMPCCALDDNFEKFSFLECKEDSKSIISIGTYHQRDKQCKSFRKDHWTPQHVKIFEKLDFNKPMTFDIKFDIKSGSLWVMVLSFAMNNKYKLSCLPLTPYSTSYSLPYLYNVDYLSIAYTSDDLDRLTSESKNSFFNMPYNGMTNLHLAIKREDMDIIKALLTFSEKHNMKLGAICKKSKTLKGMSNVLELAIRQESEELVKVVFNLFEKQQAPFSSVAYIVRESLQSLWKTNRLMFEVILSNDRIAIKIHSPYIPSKILDDYKPYKAYVGLLNDPITLIGKTDEDVAMDICASSNFKSKRKDEQSVGWEYKDKYHNENLLYRGYLQHWK